MALISGPTVGDAISDPKNAIAKLTSEFKDDRKLVEEIFMRILNRPPTAKEINAALGIAWPAWMPSTRRSPPAGQAEEAEQKPRSSTKAEQERSAAIDTPKKELDAYKVKMAPEKQEGSDARLAAITKAEAGVKTVADTAAPISRSAGNSIVDLDHRMGAARSATWSSAAGVTKLEKQPDGIALRHRASRRPASQWQLPAPREDHAHRHHRLQDSKCCPTTACRTTAPASPRTATLCSANSSVQQARLDAKRAQDAAREQVTLQQSEGRLRAEGLRCGRGPQEGQSRQGLGRIAPKAATATRPPSSLQSPPVYEGGTSFAFQLIQPFQNGKYNLGRFRIWVTTSPLVRFGTAKAVADAFKAPAAKRTKEQTAVLNEHFLDQFRDYQNAKKVLAVRQEAAARRSTARRPGDRSSADAQKPIMLDPKLVQLRRDSDAEPVNSSPTSASPLRRISPGR